MKCNETFLYKPVWSYTLFEGGGNNFCSRKEARPMNYDLDKGKKLLQYSPRFYEVFKGHSETNG